VRDKPGITAWSLLASLAFSLVVWSGCNTEEPAANPGPGATAKPATATPPPPPSTPGDTTKKAP